MFAVAYARLTLNTCRLISPFMVIVQLTLEFTLTLSTLTSIGFSSPI